MKPIRATFVRLWENGTWDILEVAVPDDADIDPDELGSPSQLDFELQLWAQRVLGAQPEHRKVANWFVADWTCD